MQNLQFYKEINAYMDPQLSSKDVLNQIRYKLHQQNPQSLAPDKPVLNPVSIVKKLQNKNWEVVEKATGERWIRFYDETTYTEYMMMV